MHKTPILKSVDKAFKILECFTLNKQEYTLSELAKYMDLSRGTIHRILLTAQKHNMIEQNPESKKYMLGMRMFEIGNSVVKRLNLRDASFEILKNLALQTGETVYILVRNNYDIICIDRIEGQNFLRALYLDVGKKMPLNISAGSKLLLSYMTDLEIEAWLNTTILESWTNYSTSDNYTLWKEIKAIRNQGYAYCSDDVVIGMAGVAAPIRNASGTVIAAVSLAGVSKNITDNAGSLINILVNDSQAISYNLGHNANY